MNDATTFGESLRQHRLARLMTQTELAERAALSERAISDLERGLKLATAGHDPFTRRRPGPGTRPCGGIRTLGPSPAALARVRRTGKQSLPSALTSLVGREEALARLEFLLDPRQTHSSPARLLTLTGAGGCGKTRLAIEVARRATGDFSDGVSFADLSTIADGALVPAVVLGSTGGRESSDEPPIESLMRHLRRKKLLLVLDNCEQLIDACARLLDTLLGACPDLRVLATSREALRVPGEVVWRVPSLTVPDSGEGVDCRSAAGV